MVTSTIAFEGDGLWREYEGSVQDWLVQSRRSRELAAAALSPAASAAATASKNALSAPATAAVQAPSVAKKKLSYKEQRELDQLPERIHALEEEQKTIQAALADGTLYSTDADRAAALHAREGAIEEDLMQALERWTALAQ